MATGGLVRLLLSKKAVAAAGVEEEPKEETEQDYVTEADEFKTSKVTKNRLKYTNCSFVKIKTETNDKTSDITIKVGRSTFLGHKNVLSAANKLLSAQISKEADEKRSILSLDNVSVRGFSTVFGYFYNGHVTIDAKDTPALLEAASVLQVDWLTKVCRHFMIGYMGQSHFELTVRLAKQYGLGDVRDELLKHFGKSLKALLDNDNFNYKEISLEIILNFLKSNIYVDVSEYNLLQMVLAWIKADPATRQNHLHSLLQQLRYPIMKPEQLQILPKELFSFKDIQTKVEEAKIYCLNPTSQCLQSDTMFLERGSSPTIVLTAFSETSSTGVIAYKDAINDEDNLFIEQTGATGLAADYTTMNQASIGNFLFACGGFTYEGETSAHAFRFNIKSREWTRIADMSEARASFALCSSDTNLFAVGGTHHADSGERLLSTVEMYTPEENVWKPLANFPFGIFDLAACHAIDTLYICGGISERPDDPSPISSTFCLSDHSYDWLPLPDLLTPRQGHSMTLHKDKLLVIGGYTNKPNGAGFKDCVTNEIFDLDTRQWTLTTPTPENFGHIFRHVGHFDNLVFFLCNLNQDVYLSHFDTDYETFHEGIVVGPGLHKVSVLNVAYPRHLSDDLLSYQWGKSKCYVRCTMYQ